MHTKTFSEHFYKMMTLKSVSWSPRGPYTPPNTPAFLFNVSRAAAYVGQSTCSEPAPLPGTIQSCPDVSVGKIQAGRFFSPQYSDADLQSKDYLETSIQYLDPRDIYLDMETQDISIKATTVLQVKPPKQNRGFLTRVIQNNPQDKATKVWPAATDYGTTDKFSTDRLVDIADMFCVESQDEAVTRRQRNSQMINAKAVLKDNSYRRGSWRIKANKVKPFAADLDVVKLSRRRLAQVSAMFCVESPETAALRRLGGEHASGTLGYHSYQDLDKQVEVKATQNTAQKSRILKLRGILKRAMSRK